MNRTKIVMLLLVVLVLIAVGHHQLVQISNQALGIHLGPLAQAQSDSYPQPQPKPQPVTREPGMHAGILEKSYRSLEVFHPDSDGEQRLHRGRSSSRECDVIAGAVVPGRQYSPGRRGDPASCRGSSAFEFLRLFRGGLSAHHRTGHHLG